MAKIALKSMSAEALLDLKEEIVALLSKKVSTERSELEAKLAKLNGFSGGAKRGRPPSAGKRGALKGSKVAPKYRDPDSGMTWSARGLKPKWLTAALKEGKKLEDFAIAGARSAMKKVTGKKRGRPSKKAA